jgi:hypothetical protein
MVASLHLARSSELIVPLCRLADSYLHHKTTHVHPYRYNLADPPSPLSNDSSLTLTF